MSIDSTIRRREVPAFTCIELEQRIERTRKPMTREKLDGLMVCSEANLMVTEGKLRLLTRRDAGHRRVIVPAWS